ncbi:MAG: HAD family hydrolase [Alphaproteobacteria bacterium]|nr:HAD family hydrolase [Alphaproteobacteria bacterium]
MMDFDLIIFDCDGVLVDSEPIANRLLRDALAKNGLEMTLDQVVDTYVGRSMSAVVTISEDLLGRSLPADFLDVLQVETFAAFKEKLKAVDGVEDLINHILLQKKKICVASSGSFEKMDFTLGLTGLRHYFGDHIYNSSQVKRGKPYPDLYLYAAERMKVEPAKCLVIEDSLPGVQGAVAAGMEVIAYCVNGQDEKCKKAGGLVFKQMSEIKKHIH